MRRARIVGLTGGIATGKSAVSRLLRELGAVVIDADAASRKVVETGSPGLEQVVQAFGDKILLPDGALDRKALGKIIFGDADARRRLDSILHPLIFREMEQELSAVLREGASVVVLDIPLLFETGLFVDTIDESVVVYARPEVQLRRLMERDGLTEEEASQRIRAQMPVDLKAQRAEHVIDNSGPWEDTKRQVKDLWKEWTVHEDSPDRPR